MVKLNHKRFLYTKYSAGFYFRILNNFQVRSSKVKSEYLMQAWFNGDVRQQKLINCTQKFYLSSVTLRYACVSYHLLII